MTYRRFGRATPVQHMALSLVGYRLTREHSGLDIPEAERLAHMREGLAMLREQTGEDFGYDLAAWHEFLIVFGNDFGYTHPYGFDEVREAVEEAIGDPDWPRLAGLAGADAP